MSDSSSSDTSDSLSDTDSVFTSYGDREEDDRNPEIGRNEDWYLYSKNSVSLKNTTKIGFKAKVDGVEGPDDWEFRDKTCIKCESEKFFQISFKLTPAMDKENVMMTVGLRASKANTRLEITRIETFSLKMTLIPNFKTGTCEPPATPLPIVKYAQIENANEMMETVENMEISSPEIFLSIGSFCSLVDMQKLIHFDLHNNRAATEHNVPSGDFEFEPGSEFLNIEIEVQARFDVFLEPDEINKSSKTGDFEFSLARHAIKCFSQSPIRWAKKMFSDSFTDVAFHVGEEGMDFPAIVKAHKSVLSARSPVFEAMCATDMEEKSTGVVKMKGVSQEAMYAFLELLYDMNPPDLYFSSPKLCLDVLELAHKYQVPELVEACVRQLVFTRMNELTFQDALRMYSLSHRFEFSDLQSRALLYFGRCKETFLVAENKDALRKFMVNENDIAPDLFSSLFCGHKNELWYEPVEEAILERIETRLDEVSKKLEEIQVQAKTTNEKLADLERRHEEDNTTVNGKISRGSIVGYEEKKESSDDESFVEFKGVEIRSKTLEQENNWLKEKFIELSRKTLVEDGASLEGTNIEAISKTIPLSIPLLSLLSLSNSETSCVLKLSNHSNYAITDPKFYSENGTKMTGPSVIVGHFNEVFLGSGFPSSFLCSFSVSSSLRLALYCRNGHTGQISFDLGLIPHNVPTDEALLWRLSCLPTTPEFCRKAIKNICGDTEPVENFVTAGQLLVRGEAATVGPRAIIQLDIFDMSDHPANGSLSNQPKNIIPKVERIMEKISRTLTRSNDLHLEGMKISCLVEMVNLLNVSVRNREPFYCTSGRHNFISTEVPPYNGVIFFASNNTNLEGLFSFEFESTDLCLAIAFRVQGKENSFAGALLPLPAPTGQQEMKKLMGGNHWMSYQWTRFAQAKGGERMLQIRNIKVAISMTEGEKSLLKIRTFAC